MSQPIYNVIQAEGSNVAEILVYGTIGYWKYTEEDGWTSELTAETFRKTIQRLDGDSSVEQINIRINSPGGLVTEGVAMFNAISNCNTTIHTHIDGIAASMAAVLALAGEKTYCASNGMMMFHNASTYLYGNAVKMRETADVLDKWDQSMITSITARTGMSEEDIREKLMNHKDNWITAKEAKELGLIHEVASISAEGLPRDITAMSHQSLFAHFRKAEQSSTPPQAIQTPQLDIMNLEALRAAIESGDIQLSEDQRASILGEAGTAEEQITNLTAERDQANTNLQEAQNRIQAVENAAGEIPEGSTLEDHITAMAASYNAVEPDTPEPGVDADLDADDGGVDPIQANLDYADQQLQARGL